MRYSCDEMIEHITHLVDPDKANNEAFLYALIDGSVNVKELPDCLHDITEIAMGAFYNCYDLALTSLPEGITHIRENAFQNCRNLALTSLPEGIDSIGSQAFYSCTGLTTLTFKGTPTSISTKAFEGCTNLTTINVPWAEGEVSAAPWGATNATINYGYTE